MQEPGPRAGRLLSDSWSPRGRAGHARCSTLVLLLGSQFLPEPRAGVSHARRAAPLRTARRAPASPPSAVASRAWLPTRKSRPPGSPRPPGRASPQPAPRRLPRPRPLCARRRPGADGEGAERRALTWGRLRHVAVPGASSRSGPYPLLPNSPASPPHRGRGRSGAPGTALAPRFRSFGEGAWGLFWFG